MVCCSQSSGESRSRWAGSDSGPAWPWCAVRALMGVAVGVGVSQVSGVCDRIHVAHVDVGLHQHQQL